MRRFIVDPLVYEVKREFSGTYQQYQEDDFLFGKISEFDPELWEDEE